MTEVLVLIGALIIIGLFAYAIDPSVDDPDWFEKWVNDR